MTPEEFEKLVIGGVPGPLVEAMAPLDEPGRKALAKTAVRLFRERPGTGWVGPEPSCEHLAVFGVCSWSDAKRVRVYTPGKPSDPIYRVLEARRPEWIGKWVEQELTESGANWPLIRQLIRAKVCERPPTDSYITRMVQSRSGHYVANNCVHLAHWLREDGDLLMDLWRIFEIDFGRELVFTKDSEQHPGSWQSALIGLANSGEMNRDRMLTASLTARQTRPDNATFFCRLHEALSPMIEERVERQSHYRALLSSPIPGVVGFALGALKEIAQAGRLDIDPFLAAVGPALELRQKKHATLAMQVLELASKQSPGRLGPIAMVATRGLGHGSPDVQKRCALLIDSAAALGPDEALAEAVEAQLGTVAPSVRPLAEAAMKRLRQGSEPTEAGADETPATISEMEIETIPARWRALAGVNECLNALHAESGPPPLDFDPMAVPRLDPAAALVPISSFDELVDRISAAVEELSDADELELLLDGISRLTSHLRLDFSARTAPLLTRVGKLIGADTWGGRSLDPVMRFRFLVRSWIQRQPLEVTTGDLVARGVEGFLTLRMTALSNRLTRDVAGPLLACPTHRGGWIDPRDVVGRVRFWQESDRNRVGGLHDSGIPDRYDLIQALLRLAPDYRSAALKSAADLSGEAGAALRFALGGEETLGRSAGIWIAAARARQPREYLPALAEHLGDLGPDAAVPANYEWEADARVQEAWRAHPTPKLRIRAVPVVRPEHLAPDRPLAYLNRLESPYYFASVLHLRCRAAVWPANPDASFAGGALDIVLRLNDPPSSFSPTAQTLDPLFDPDTPFTEMARLALAVALLSKDAGTRGLGVDALIALIDDGRCTGSELGPVYGKLAKPEVVRLNRLTASLAEVARVSELHQWVVARVLSGTLAALPHTPREDLHHLLSALHEGLIATSQSLPAECRPLLERITTSGKTARLAKSLLSFQESTPANRHRLKAMREALEGRIARARRWAGRESGVGLQNP